MKVYFAHPWGTETDGSAKIVKLLLEMRFKNWIFINPFKHKLTEEWLADKGNVEIAEKIVTKDLDLIRESDIVIAFLPSMLQNYIPVGTCMEILYSKQFGKPVYVFTGKTSPWIIAHATFVTSVFDNLVKKLKEEYK